MSFTSQLRLWRQPFRSTVRQLTTASATATSTPTPTATATATADSTSPTAASEKQFVRIAGPSSYASSNDIINFLHEQSVPFQNSLSSLVQGQADIFQNHSVWLYDARTQADAEHIASKISGKVLGLKLIRAAAVDQKIVDSMLHVPDRSNRQRITLRRRLNAIAPAPEERGRTLLASNLPHLLRPRNLWSFFSNYEVIDIKLLRKAGVACVVFSSEDEALRALRERANLSLHGKQPINLKMHH